MKLVSQLSRSLLYAYPAALIFAVAFYILQMISLPIEITYDGLGYIDMADVLGSPRFPHDWQANRTPLFPLALKVSFSVIGRQPLAPVFLSTTLVLLGVVLVSRVVKKMAGTVVAAAVVVMLSLHPTLVAYEHSVLTEAGTFAFIAMIVCVTVWNASTEQARWKRCWSAIAVLSLGFYWRQNILAFAPLVALLFAYDEWPHNSRLSEVNGARPPRRYRFAAVILCRSCLVVVVPFLASKPWSAYSPPEALRDVTIRQGIIRQALLPPDDPFVAPYKEEYRATILDSMQDGDFYSGVKWAKLSDISEKLFAKPLPDGTLSFFVGLVRKYPDRYLSGFCRTLLFFAGFNGAESDNRIYRDQVFSPTLTGSKVSDGPEPLQTRIKEEFHQNTTVSILLSLMRRLAAPYDMLVIAGSFITVLGLGAGLLLRDRDLLTACSIAVLYPFSYALFLVSIDRFALPVQPLFLCNLLLVPTLLFRRRRAREQVATASASHLTKASPR